MEKVWLVLEVFKEKFRLKFCRNINLHQFGKSNCFFLQQLDKNFSLPRDLRVDYDFKKRFSA